MANLRWLRPGLGIKRWVVIICAGVALLIVGAIIFGLGLFGAGAADTLLSPYTFGLTLILLGGAGVFVGIYRLARHIEKIVKSHNEPRTLSEIALAQSAQGPKIVCIGGGTGMNRLLTGLREYGNRITAVVSVADDGGSSGRLRNEFGVLPPGDIRNCLSALAGAGATMSELMQYRFGENEGELSGHAFGNLLIMVLTKICGSFDGAVREANNILNVRGQVLPVATEPVTLVATHPDGTKTTGQKNISRCGKKISELAAKPTPGAAPPDVLERLADADAIVIGPGSLYTSIIPNLLMPDVARAINRSRAKVFFIVNTMAQPGETAGFRASDYLAELKKHGNDARVDAAIVNNYKPSPVKLAQLAQDGKTFTEFNSSANFGATRVLLRDVINIDDPEKHDSAKLARVIVEAI
jgi:uncharacterized cofD-like protein